MKGITLRAELPPHQGELTLAEYVENCNDYLAYRGLNGRVLPDGSYNPDAADTGGVAVVVIRASPCAPSCRPIRVN